MLVMIAFIDHLHILQYFGGDIWFTLSSFLHRSPLAVIFFGVTLCVIAACTPKNVSRILLVLYLAFIAYMTLLFREPGSGNPIPAPFWSYRLFFSNRIIRRQILNNIWLFIPLGALLGRLFPRNRFIFFVPTLVCATIEASQYFFRLGLCEFDDVFSNSLGGLIGIAVYYVLAYWRRRFKRP